jgi:hypothetical protein
LVVNMSHNPLDKTNNPHQNHTLHLHNMHNHHTILCTSLLVHLFQLDDDTLHIIVGQYQHVLNLHLICDMYHLNNVSV